MSYTLYSAVFRDWIPYFSLKQKNILEVILLMNTYLNKNAVQYINEKHVGELLLVSY